MLRTHLLRERVPNGPVTDHLLPQAIIRDRQTFFDDMFTEQARFGGPRSENAGPVAGARNQGCGLFVLLFFAAMFVLPLLFSIVFMILKVFVGG